MLRMENKMNKGIFSHYVGFNLTFFFLLFSTVFAGSNHDAPQEAVNYYVQEWRRISQNDTLSESVRQEKLSGVLDNMFYFSRLAPQLVQKTWPKLTSYEQEQFIKALKISILHKIKTVLGSDEPGADFVFALKNADVKENFANLDYELKMGTARKNVKVYLLKNPEKVWKVSNLKIGKISILRYYYTFCKKLLGKYSFPYLVGELGEYGYVVLEDFESSDVDTLPRGWGWKKKDNEKHKPYRVKEENGNKYLAATDEGESVIIGKDKKWNLKKYPYISFRWRVHEIPEGGDERFNKTVDSAAGIYLVYKKKLGLIPESVKFVWSSTLPVGSAMRRSGIGRPWMVVAATGKEHLGEWRTFVFNAYETYKKTFGGEPPDTALGIGILSDANSTKSKAYADYDDIRMLKNATADSGVKKILKAE